MSKKSKQMGTMLIVLSIAVTCHLYGAQHRAKSSQQEKQAKKKLQKEKTACKGIGTFNGEKQIILGTTAPISGSLYKLGNDLTKGMGIVFNEVNRAGGIHDYAIKLIVRDDHYDPSAVKKNIDSLRKKTSLLFGTFGSDSLSAIPKSELAENLILLPDAGLSNYRKPEYTSMIFFRPSTGDEVRALIDHLMHKLFRRKIAIFYEDSLWGKDGKNAAKKYIKTHKNLNAECVAEGSYIRNTVNVQNAVDLISKASPEAVICIAHYRPTYSFIRGMLNKGSQQTKFCGVSETALMQDYLKQSRGVSLLTSSVVPNPWNSKLPIVEEYRKAMKKYLPNYKLSIMSLEGYINAKLFAETLKKVRPPITKQKIISAFSRWQEAEFLGLRISYNEQTRGLSETVWLNEKRRAEWVASRKGGK